MKKYDYLIPTKPRSMSETERWLKKKGRKGWKLVSVSNGILYLRRPRRQK